MNYCEKTWGDFIQEMSYPHASSTEETFGIISQ